MGFIWHRCPCVYLLHTHIIQLDGRLQPVCPFKSANNWRKIVVLLLSLMLLFSHSVTELRFEHCQSGLFKTIDIGTLKCHFIYLISNGFYFQRKIFTKNGMHKNIPLHALSKYRFPFLSPLGCLSKLMGFEGHYKDSLVPFL